MGVKLKDLVVSKPVSLDNLRNKILIVDAMNVLYQFLTTIRQMDGTPLKTSKGKVSSHLVGLFSRTTKLMSEDIKLAFVFDGIAPELKMQEREKRMQAKVNAQMRYEEALRKEDIDEMKKYAARTSRLDSEMISEAKELLDALGVPCVQALSEGEAQASFMVSKGDGYAIATEDFDSLLFNVPRLIRGLSVTQRKKQKDAFATEKTEIELIDLQETLNKLEISHDQLIALGILVGTDFNPGGIKGIGPKNALKLVKKYKSDFSAMFAESGWENCFSYSWQDVFAVFKDMKHKQDYKLEWKSPDVKKLNGLLVERFEFSEKNVSSKIEMLQKSKIQHAQKGLGDFFKK